MTKIKNNFLTGALILAVCSIISKILGAIYKIPLLKILGSDGLGEYQMVISVYALFLVLASSGMTVTLSKLISRETTYNNKFNQKKYLLAGITISVFLSIILMLILFAICPFISKYQNSSGLTYSYLAISPAIIFSSLIGVFRGFFLGKRKMTYSGGVQILEAVLKLVFSLYLSLKFSNVQNLGAVFGAVLGITIAEIISLIAIIALFIFKNKSTKKLNANIKYKKTTNTIFNLYLTKNTVSLNDKEISINAKNNCKNDKKIIKNDKKRQNTSQNILFFVKNSRYKTYVGAVKDVVYISFLITLQACIFPLLSAIDGLVVVPLLLKTGLSQSIAYSLFGLEDGVVSSIISMPTIIATSIGASIIPNLKNSINKEKQILNALKIVWLASIFCAMIFIFFAPDITRFLYGSGLTSKTINELGISADLLRLNGFNIIYICVLSICTSILQGLDKSILPVKNLIIASAVRFLVLTICLTNEWLNIYGLALADMSFYSIAMILNFVSIKKLIDIKFEFKKLFVLPTFSLMITFLTMQLVKIILPNLLPFRVIVLAFMICGFIVYISILFAAKVFNVQDLFALRKKKILKN